MVKAIYDVIIDILSSKSDRVSENLLIDKCDLSCLRADKLFGCEEKRIFKNKRDFVLSVYGCTNNQILPIGM